MGNAKQKYIENIVTTLDKTRLDENKMTQSVDSSKRGEKHEPEVNLDPEPLSSIRQSHRHQTREQGKRSARRRKSVVSIGKMTCPTYL